MRQRAFAFVLEKGSEMLEFHLSPCSESGFASPRDELVQQPGVGALGVRGLAAFVAEVLKKILNERLHGPREDSISSGRSGPDVAWIVPAQDSIIVPFHAADLDFDLRFKGGAAHREVALESGRRSVGSIRRRAGLPTFRKGWAVRYPLPSDR